MPGLGYAFVQYTTVLEAAGAARALRLKTFNERQVQVDYYPLALYLKEVGVWEGVECRTTERWESWCNFIWRMFVFEEEILSQTVHSTLFDIRME